MSHVMCNDTYKQRGTTTVNISLYRLCDWQTAAPVTASVFRPWRQHVTFGISLDAYAPTRKNHCVKALCLQCAQQCRNRFFPYRSLIWDSIGGNAKSVQHIGGWNKREKRMVQPHHCCSYRVIIMCYDLYSFLFPYGFCTGFFVSLIKR